jgi:hypothetical protein
MAAALFRVADWRVRPLARLRSVSTMRAGACLDVDENLTERDSKKQKTTNFPNPRRAGPGHRRHD